LIREKALLLSSVGDPLTELEYERVLPHLNIAYPRVWEYNIGELDEVEFKLIKLFEGGEALDADRIAKQLQITAADITSALMMFKLKG
tara:strand:+ start:4309 stop:4572 length:264 start_codon:yes stop_codon:yes gene_type:complete